jgi:signal transduction histidine kinase
MRQADQTLQLEIEDNGRGFNLASSGDTKSVAELTRPWSLHSRVQHLGGGLMLYSGNGGSKVTITLPLTGIGARAA